MPEFTKDVIRPGRFIVKGKVVEVTADDIAGWMRDFEAMQKAGLRVPVPWEHPALDDEEGFPVDSTDSEKVNARNRAKYNAGWLKKLHLEDDGTLQAVLDIPRKSDAEKVSEIGTFVSPQFGKWTDGTGRTWDNPITHMALTPKPINAGQTSQFAAVKPEPVAAAPGPLRFSLSDQIQFADDGDSGGDSNNEPPPGDPKADADKDGVPDPKDTDSNTLEAIRAALQEIGVVMPEGTELSGDLKVLLAAVQSYAATNAKHEAKNGNGQQQQMQPGQTPPGVTEENTSTVSMAISDGENGGDDEETNDVRKNLIAALEGLGLTIADDSKLGEDVEFLSDLLSSVSRHIEYRERRRKERAAENSDSIAMSREEQEMQTQMSREIETLRGEVTKGHREKYSGRIEAAEKTGRITKPDADKLRSLADQYQFSAAGQDSVSELDIRLEVVEALPAGTHWTDKEQIERFSIQEERRNNNFWDGEEFTAEQVDDYAKQVAGR